MIDEIRVGRNLDMSTGGQLTSRLGDPANNMSFPTGLNLTIGSPASRGRIQMSTGSWNANALLRAASGGSFTGYLGNVTLATSIATPRNSTA